MLILEFNICLASLSTSWQLTNIRKKLTMCRWETHFYPATNIRKKLTMCHWETHFYPGCLLDIKNGNDPILWQSYFPLMLDCLIFGYSFYLAFMWSLISTWGASSASLPFFIELRLRLPLLGLGLVFSTIYPNKQWLWNRNFWIFGNSVHFLSRSVKADRNDNPIVE